MHSEGHVSVIVGSAKWVTAAQFCKILMQFIGISVFTRFLPAGAFGLMAAATIFINFSNIIKDLGTSSAIIQKEKINQNLLTAIFWTNILTGILLGLLMVAAASEAAAFFSSPELANFLIFLSPLFPLTCFGAVHQALLERQSKFRALAGIELTASILGLASGLVTAIGEHGTYALPVQLLVYSAVFSILTASKTKWAPNRTYPVKELKSIVSFSGGMTAFSLVNFAARNVDSTLIGKHLGQAALGSYSLAYRLMLFPVQNLSFVLNRALLPTFSRVGQSDKLQLNVFFLKNLSVVSTLSAPIMVFMWIERESVVSLLYGNNWSHVSKLVLWLAPVGFIQSLNSTIGPVYIALGKTSELFFLGVIGFILHGLAFYFGVKNGLEPATKYYLLSTAINAMLAFIFIGKALKIKSHSVWMAVLPSMTTAALSAMICKEVLQAVASSEDVLLTLIFRGFLFVIIYIIISLVTNKKIMLSASGLIFLKKNKVNASKEQGEQ